MFNTAISMVQDHAAAEDITQEVFVTVFRSLAAFNERSDIGTWIYRITVNKCLDFLRSKKRRKYSLFSQISGSAQNEVSAPFDHPGILLEHKETAKYLFEAVNILPGNQKTAFVLSQVEELPQSEIAAIMGISVKAVEGLIQRSKANLRKKLSGIYDRGKTNQRTSK